MSDDLDEIIDKETKQSEKTKDEPTSPGGRRSNRQEN